MTTMNVDALVAELRSMRASDRERFITALRQSESASTPASGSPCASTKAPKVAAHAPWEKWRIWFVTPKGRVDYMFMFARTREEAIELATQLRKKPLQVVSVDLVKERPVVKQAIRGKHSRSLI